MPLLHQDTSRAGCSERPRSLVDFNDFNGFDPPRSEPNPIPKANHRANDILIQENCAWESPGSPPAAQTPRALVPAACFPPRHTSAYNSYSESARPGANWDPSSSTEIADLVASLKTLAVPSKRVETSLQRVETSLQLRLKYESYDTYDNSNVNTDMWQSEPQSARDDRVTRRASFCGVVSSGRNGELVRWSGVLPARSTDLGGGVSPKVFLGGLPWDIDETALMDALRPFQPVRLEWPGREQASGTPRGFAYMTFENERCVRALLAASRRDGVAWYYRISSRKLRYKDVQVIPWAVCDSTWVLGASTRLEPSRTVFVGALHGMLSALALATICNDLFQGVVYAAIDTDKNKYPIGSGRVAFNNVHSYVRAISANYVVIRTDKFTKKVQIDPYLEDSMCSVCEVCQGPYFCRVPACFRYFCRSCWVWQHPNDEHKPLMRVSRGQPNSPSSPVPSCTSNGSLKAITNGPMNGMTNGVYNGPSTSNGQNGSTNGPNDATNGPNGLTNGPNGLTNGLNGMTNGHGHRYQSDEGVNSPNMGYDKTLTNGHMGYENGPYEYGSKSAYSDVTSSKCHHTDNRLTNGPNKTYQNDTVLTHGPKMGYQSDNVLTNGYHSDKSTNGPNMAYKDSNGPNKYQDSNGPNKYQDSNGHMYTDSNMYTENGLNKYHDVKGANVYRDCNSPNKYNLTNGYQNLNGPNMYQDRTGSNVYQDSIGPTANNGYRSSTSDHGPISNGPIRNLSKMGFRSPISSASDYSVYSSSASPNGNSDGSGSPTSPSSGDSHDSPEWR